MPRRTTDQSRSSIEEFAYQPDRITVSPGQEVVFANGDETAHTATAKDGSFNSEAIDAGASATITAPDQAGEYAFYCSFHPFMKGTLVVE